MKHPAQLSDLQMSILRVLWDRREATVADVHEALFDERGLATTTIATVLTRLEKRGLLEHRREGRQFIYRPLATEDEVRRTMVSELTERVFQGDVTELVSHLLDDQEIDSGDLERVKRLLEAKARERKE